MLLIRNFVRRVPLRVVLLASAVAGSAAAQVTTSTPVQAATADEMIVVTAPHYVPDASVSANKDNIPLIQTPQSVSVISRDQIDLLAFVDAQQAVRYTAGVFGENYGPDLRFDFLTVRGFTPKQYIDGLAAPISTSIYSVGVDLYAFDSFEILKGPASVLYGNAPPGGIYNQISRRASADFGGEISAKYGTDDYKQVAGTVTGAVTSFLDVRFTGLYRDRDSERDFVHAKRLLASPTATLKLDPDTSLTGLLYYQYDQVRGDTNGFLPVYGTLLPNPVGKVSRSTNLGDPSNLYERRQFGAGFEFEHNFSDSVAFHSNAKWSHYSEDTPTGVYGGGGLVNTTDPTLPSYYRTVSRYNFSYREQVSSFAVDNRLSATVDTGPLKHQLLGGVDYRNVRNVADFGFVGAGTIDLFDPVYAPLADAQPGYPSAFNDQRLRQTGVYGQDHIQLDKLFVTLGGRYDWVKVEDFNADASRKQHRFTWRAGANYVLDSGVAPYVSYATSFEPVLGTDSLTGDAFKPSTGKQVEAGVKYDGRGMTDDFKIFATAAAFDIKQTNVVSTSPSVTPVFGTQSGAVEVYGGEIEIVARIRQQLAINASYSYTHSEVTRNANFAGEVGQPLPTTPKHKFSLFADYTIAQGRLGGLGLGAGGRYTSDSAGSLPGAFNPVVYYGQSATLFDAIVHYDTRDWRLAINGSNILDKRYVARCSGPAGCNFGAGRQVLGTVTRKF